MQERITTSVKDALRDTFTIAKVNKDDAAEITPAVNPTHKNDTAARVRQAEGPAVVSTAQFAEEVERNARFHVRSRWRAC